MSQPPHPSPLPTLTLYSRQDCHLCDQAEEHLRLLEFRYHKVDIDQDSELRRQYGDHVPVLALAGRVLARGVLSKPRLSLLKIQLLRERAQTEEPS